MSAVLAPGSIVYNRQGHEAEYVGALPNGRHAVRPGHTCYSPDPDQGEYTSYEGLTEWPEVYVRPPVEKLHTEVAALSAQAEDARKAIRELRQERWAVDEQIAARKDALKQHAALAQLDDYLAGRITHFVIQKAGYSERTHTITIQAFKDALTEKDSWSRDRLKLLVLFGDSKGDLTWGINEYRSSGGDDRVTVIPCLSLEQAREVAKGLYEAELALWRAAQANPSTDKQERRPWHPSTLVEHAKRLELPIPQDAVEAHAAEKLASARNLVENQRKALLNAVADLQALEREEAVSKEGVATPKPA